MSGKDAASTPRRPGRLSRWFVAALFVLAACVVIRSMAPQTIGETARRQLLTQFQRHYPELSVHIGRGRFEPDIGLVFEDLRISQPSVGSFQFASQEIARIDRLTVVADIHPEMLLDKKLPMITRQVVVEGVHANAWLDATGKLSLEQLFPLPKFGPAAPVTVVRDATVRLIGAPSQRRPIDVDIVQATIVSRNSADGKCDKTISLKGRADFANELIVKCDLIGGAIDVRAAIKNANLNRDLFDRLPRQWSDVIRQARDLDCVCDTTVAAYRPADGDWNFQTRTTLHEGRFTHPQLPKPITQLRGVFVADPTGIEIEASQGMLGDALVRVTGEIEGLAWPSDAKLNVSARGLLLDDQLAAALPAATRAQWDRLRPLGRIDLDAELAHGESWTADATIVCKGVDVRFEKFPYPIQQMVGRIEVRDGIASSTMLDGRLGGQRMQCAFRLPIKKGITNEKSFVMATDGPIPIDDTLIASLTPRGADRSKLESFVRSLSPGGLVHLVSASLTTDKSGKPTRNIDMRVVDGRLRYKKFAYPLYNVEGSVKVQDNVVKVVGFRASNANAGLILCDGGYRMPTAGTQVTEAQTSHLPRTATYQLTDQPKPTVNDSLLSLTFRSSNVPMDESLRSSLPASTQHIWDAISPSGVLDELKVTIGQTGADPNLSIDLTAKQQPTTQVTSRSLSLRPRSFPYRIDVTGGVVRFDGSEVTIESLDGRHDGSTLAADGRCVRGADGRWELSLNLHSGSRLHPDAELVAATPTLMREAMRRLQIRGPVGIRGTTRLLLSDETHPEPAIDWDVVLQLEGNRIGDVGPVHSLRGEVSVQGTRDDLGLRARGTVHIDSMHVNDLQLTAIRGPFAVNGDRLILGGGPIRRTKRPTLSDLERVDSEHSIVGRAFDGNLRLDGEVILSRANFDVDLAVSDAQITTLLADFGYSDSELKGDFAGKATLQGRLGNAELLKGGGAAKLSNANVYQLPLIVQLLSQLRVKPSEAVAFTDGELEFSVFGDTVTFSDLQLWGNLVALHGGGTLDRRREVDLTFNTRVSPQNTFTQVFSPLKSQRYTLWTIDVRGPLASPEIERRALEGVGETIDFFLPAINADATTTQSPSRSRSSGWFR